MRTITTKAIALLITLSITAFAQQKGTLTDSRDKKTYKTVIIGEQVWMAENLNYNAKGSKCYAEGVSGVSADSSAKNCAKYGRMYDWKTAMALPANCNESECNSQISKPKHTGICPSGWHIPGNADWNALMKFINPSCSSNNNTCTGAGAKLKATSGWNVNPYKISGNGTDNYGFSALPSGEGDDNSYFDNIGNNSSWWSSPENNNNFAYILNVSHLDENAYKYDNGKFRLFSVRCLQDEGAAEQPKQAEQPKKAEQPKQQSANENCSLTFPKKSCVSMPKGTCQMAGGKVVDKCP